jgi:6,7-dimethyl-8-ribityllumazine synthase
MPEQPGTTLEGNYDASGLRFGIVCARFNRLFVDHLLAGAMDAIVRHGGSADLVTVAWVPGSYEIPVVAKELANTDVDAVIALGVVIDGATSHADHINSAVSGALTSIACDTGIPVIGGVVNCSNLEQATERCGTKAGNRGADAARTAIEMANLIKQFDD